MKDWQKPLDVYLNEIGMIIAEKSKSYGSTDYYAIYSIAKKRRSETIYLRIFKNGITLTATMIKSSSRVSHLGIQGKLEETDIRFIMFDLGMLNQNIKLIELPEGNGWKMKTKV